MRTLQQVAEQLAAEQRRRAQEQDSFVERLEERFQQSERQWSEAIAQLRGEVGTLREAVCAAKNSTKQPVATPVPPRSCSLAPQPAATPASAPPPACSLAFPTPGALAAALPAPAITAPAPQTRCPQLV